MFGPPDIDNRHIITKDNECVLKLFTDAMCKLIEEPDNTSNETLTYPLKILINFFFKHDNTIVLTIKDLSYPMIKFMH
jgi:hypothetical protein